MDCVFCKIASGEFKSHKVHESDYFIAVLDITPATDFHTLIIPKTHAENLLDMSDACAREFLPFAQVVAKAVIKATGAQGFNLLQNNGPAAGQTVFHFHAHIIPRQNGDTITIGWNGKSSSEDLLKKNAARLVECINEMRQ